jgi:Kelch motif
MVSPHALRHARKGALLVFGAGAAASGCRTATEISVVITTDAQCKDVRGTLVTVGKLGELETKPSASFATTCDAVTGRIGAVVLFPSGSDDEEVGIKVVTALSQPVEACVPPDYKGGCIVARRAVHFVPHTNIELPVAMQVVCRDIPCGATQTCQQGRCVSAVLSAGCTDPAGCNAPGDGGGTDAGAPIGGDGGGTDGGAPIGVEGGPGTTGPIVLFGGSPALGTLLGDTWEWDGGWTSRGSGNGPPARDSLAMAPLNGKVVVFGGLTSTGTQSDTWEWDGTSWTQRTVTGPSPRQGSVMANLLNKVVLFGGKNGAAYLGDTWEWDGTSWNLRLGAGAGSPSPRWNAAMASLNGKVVLFGGTGSGGVSGIELGDTWEWDGTSWSQKATQGPSPRADAAMASLNGKVVLFGGGTSVTAAPNDTWAWDSVSWTRLSTTGPSQRTDAAMASLNGKVVLFGGDDTASSPLNDTWEWDGTTWTEMLVPGSPPARGFAFMSSR